MLVVTLPSVVEDLCHKLLSMCITEQQSVYKQLINSTKIGSYLLSKV